MNRIVALTTMVVWLGGFYHDVWLAAADIGHHHHHTDGHQQKDHEPTEDQGSESIPLPDTHSVPFLLTKVELVSGLAFQGDTPDKPSSWLEQINIQGTSYPNAPPHPRTITNPRSNSLAWLANCVQPNAPPVFA